MHRGSAAMSRAMVLFVRALRLGTVGLGFPASPQAPFW
jgi:hypothetical protein